MRKHIVMAVLVMGLAGSAYALPDYSQDIWYYDSQGNLIGWYALTCNGQHYSGGTTSEIYEFFSMPCETMEPITCADNGMYELSGCDGWCYSGGYVMSFNNDMVPDCGGICEFGEGPGATGGMYCSTCWKNTGSCPTSGRMKRKPKPRPTLTAALNTKMFEVYALLRR